VLGEPRREEPRSHRETRLADTVLAAVRRCHLGRNRGDEDDRRGERRIGAPAGDLFAGDCLRQEVRPHEICADQIVEALFGCVEQIGSDARRAAGVIDQHVDRAAALPHLIDEADPVLRKCEVGGCIVDLPSVTPQLVEHRGHVCFGAHAAEREVPAIARKRAGDTETDAARAAGHERSPASCSAHGASPPAVLATLTPCDAPPKNVR
jgi:hypothetical protein